MGVVQGDLASNRPGDAIRRKLAELEPNGLKRHFARWSSDPEVRRWAQGLIGERVTGQRLNTLRRRGWRVLHAIQWPSGSDIDHLAIGPAGVFTINSKHHKGKTVWYGDRAITVNRAPMRHVVISKHEALRAGRALSAGCGFSVPVRPVVAVVGAREVLVKNAAPDVLVVEGARVDRLLSGLSPVLSQDQIDRVFEAARQTDTWR